MTDGSGVPQGSMDRICENQTVGRPSGHFAQADFCFLGGVKMLNQNEIRLQGNTYPGRGIVCGMTPDGRHLCQVYWIMGRSENSRNRVFEQVGDGVRTKAFDESKMTDPSLIIYYPLRQYQNSHIITNGDQTDTIYEFLREGKTFEQALLTRQFEPDQPNCTPRISGIIYAGETPSYALSILKTIQNDDTMQEKVFFTFDHFSPGEGRCIHTYECDGNPLPSFSGEPYSVELLNDLNENAEKFWGLLDRENRVSLLVKFVDVLDGSVEIKIINRYE